MTLQRDDVPEDMLMIGDKLIGICKKLDKILAQPRLQFRTCMHDELVSYIDLEINLERGYEKVILLGVRENHVLNTLIYYTQYGSQLTWNSQEIYPVAVGYVTPTNKNNPDDQIIIVIATREVKPDASCCN